MVQTTLHFRMGPEFTPQAVKKIILYTIVISLSCAVLNNLFVYLFQMPGPLDWLSLSWWGLKNFLFFQPATFLLTHHTTGAGITFFYLLALFFNMYILWVFGSELAIRTGEGPFARFYFITGGLAGLAALLMMPLTGQYGVISGSTPAILALLVAWTMHNPEAELTFFFLLPVKAKWLTAGIIAFLGLTTLSQADLVHFFLYFFAVFFGYLYSVAIWSLTSPFPKLSNFELFISRQAAKVRRWGRFIKKAAPSRSKKQSPGVDRKEADIVDISTREPLSDDDAFIDAMLEKISKHGQHSLTWHERERMRSISERKKNS